MLKICTFILSITFLFSINIVSAAYVDGESLGIFDEQITSGVAAEQTLANILGIDVSLVTFLGKIDLPFTDDGDFSIEILDSFDDDAFRGIWTYTGIESANYITLKAGQVQNGGGLEVLFFQNPNMGNWDTGNLSDKGLSNIAAFQVVPIPAALPLLVSGLGGLLLFTRRK